MGFDSKAAGLLCALSDKLGLLAARILRDHLQFARGRGWGRSGRAARRLNRAQSYRLRQAVLDYRRSFTEVTNQAEYDELVNRARRHVVALARNDWDALPSSPITRSAPATIAGAFTTCLISAAAGIAVNAASAHLPSMLERPHVAYAAVIAGIVIGTVVHVCRWDA